MWCSQLYLLGLLPYNDRPTGGLNTSQVKKTPNTPRKYHFSHLQISSCFHTSTLPMTPPSCSKVYMLQTSTWAKAGLSRSSPEKASSSPRRCKRWNQASGWSNMMNILYSIMLYYIMIIYYTISYYTMLYYTTLYHISLCYLLYYILHYSYFTIHWTIH